MKISRKTFFFLLTIPFAKKQQKSIPKSYLHFCGRLSFLAFFVKAEAGETLVGLNSFFPLPKSCATLESTNVWMSLCCRCAMLIPHYRAPCETHTEEHTHTHTLSFLKAWRWHSASCCTFSLLPRASLESCLRDDRCSQLHLLIKTGSFSQPQVQGNPKFKHRFCALKMDDVLPVKNLCFLPKVPTAQQVSFQNHHILTSALWRSHVAVALVEAHWMFSLVGEAILMLTLDDSTLSLPFTCLRVWSADQPFVFIKKRTY